MGTCTHSTPKIYCTTLPTIENISQLNNVNQLHVPLNYK